jgi:2-octaprenyl-6-methoxyphenol hydroxylase
MSAPARVIEADVIVVGGGLAGSLLAHALLAVSARVVLIEARRAQELEQPGFDSRATALANGSVRILDRLGLWSDVVRGAEKISHIHIGQQGRFGMARIHAEEEGVDSLGYTVENRVLGEVLWRGLEQREGLTVLSPARLVRFTADSSAVAAEVEAGGGRIAVRARLLAAADGARSTVRDALGISAQAVDYGQQAIVANCAFDRPHCGWAFERFTPGGPLAILPLADRCAIVWTLATPAADAMIAAKDADFAAALQRAFGFRLGRIRRVGARAAHSLYRLRSDTVTGPRSVLIGNAAVSMHPVAGQSFNLAVRDIATLAELIAAAPESNELPTDPGSPELLATYRRWRAGDQRNVAWFTHGLVTGMALDLPGIAALRGLGLIAFDVLPGAKRALARHTMGLGGRVPRLARGLDLR